MSNPEQPKLITSADIPGFGPSAEKQDAKVEDRVEREKRPLPSFDTYVKSLLSDESIKNLEPHVQGDIIADRFVGALVRHGEVKGSQKAYSPQEILELMDHIKDDSGLRTITKTDGLRDAINMLSTDERVGRAFGTLSDRLGHDERGRLVLSSVAQIEGYIQSGGSANRIESPVMNVHTHGDDWAPIVLEHVANMTNDTYVPWMTLDKARENMGSDLPLIKESARDWQKAAYSAQEVGVDLDLIGRSAEHIQQKKKLGHDMGHRALLLAMGSRVDDYRKDLSRRGSIF